MKRRPQFVTRVAPRRTGISPVERAIIERDWHREVVSAQIHAIIGDDSDQFVGAAGRVLYVVLGAVIAEEVDAEMPEVRILRGACNALYEQAGEPRIDPMRRESIKAGLEAADRLLTALERRSLVASACELHVKLRAGHLDWSHFQPRLAAVAA